MPYKITNVYTSSITLTILKQDGTVDRTVPLAPVAHTEISDTEFYNSKGRFYSDGLTNKISVVFELKPPSPEETPVHYESDVRKELASELQDILDVKDLFAYNDILIRFKEPTYNGTHAGAAVVIDIYAADGDGTPNPFTKAAGVTVGKTGSAVIAETMPVLFTSIRVSGRLWKKATIHVTDAVAEAVTLSLTDSKGTGLDVTNTSVITFA